MVISVDTGEILYTANSISRFDASFESALEEEAGVYIVRLKDRGGIDMARQRRTVILIMLAIAICLLVGAWGYFKWVDYETGQVVDQAWSVAEGPANYYEKVSAAFWDFVAKHNEYRTIRVVNIEKRFSFLFAGKGEMRLRVTYHTDRYDGRSYDQTHTIKLYVERRDGAWVAVESKKGY